MQGTFNHSTSALKKIENGIQVKHQARFFFELTLAVFGVVLALYGCATVLDQAGFADTWIEGVVLLSTTFWVCGGAWKYCTFREKELMQRAVDEINEMRRDLGFDW